ncbi:MAG: glycosyltransferase family 4 protein [Planctomycetota bacterium]
MAELWLRRNGVAVTPPPGVELADPASLRRDFRSPSLLFKLARYARVRVLAPQPETLDHRWATLSTARLLSHGTVELGKPDGPFRRINTSELIHLSAARLQASLRSGELIVRIRRLAQALALPARPVRFTAHGGALCLRCDPWYGVTAGGSVAHIAGIVNELSRRLPGTVLASTDTVPTVDPAVGQLHLPASRVWHDDRELAAIAANAAHARALIDQLRTAPPALVYQRSAAFSLLGAWCARRYRVPLVLEFNGSETWLARHWGRPIARETLCDELELTALRSADLVVAVSAAMRDGLLARGLKPERVLCCPNGVDTQRYRPDVDGAELRARLGWNDAIVIGFIGTCGPWHGIELLAQAFARAHERCPRLRLLLIGDGVALPAAREYLRTAGVLAAVHLPGLVPQHEGPHWLAACDVLVNPTLPNADGSPFFGSPTKLFEYVAMGRAVVSSNIGQASEVIAHDRTGLLVPPADAEALSTSLIRLAADPDLRHRLGVAARAEAVARHGWNARVDLILGRLRELLP